MNKTDKAVKFDTERDNEIQRRIQAQPGFHNDTTTGQAVTDSRTVASVNIERAMLVYQSGIANVFAVDCFNLNSFGRNARRLMQHAFSPCENFARGLAAAGVIVRTASCNVAGDCANVQWTDGIEATPFRESCNPVNENNLTPDEIAEFAVLFPAD